MHAGFGGRDLVGRDLVACSRFWTRDNSRQLSFAGPRPSGKVRSFAPQTDMVATTRQICRSPLVLSVGHAEWRKHPGVIGFPLPEDHGLWEKGRSLAATGMPDKNSKKIAFWRILNTKCIWHFCLVPRLPPVPVFAPGSG